MKKFILALVLGLGLSAQAQTSSSNIFSAFQPLLNATNYTFDLYGTYAPQAPTKARIGAGGIAFYNLNQYVAPGIGVDYLGQFSLVSGNLALRYPISLFGSTNVTVTPFALAGLGAPISGTSISIVPATIVDAGGYLTFGHVFGGKLNTGACYGSWGNAGAYSGPRYHFFLGWSKGF